MINIKKKVLIGILIGLIFIGNNLVWYKLYKREKEKLKNSIVSTMSDDYFTNKVAQVNKYLKNMEKKHESKKQEKNIKDVPLILQMPDYPNGCEAASSVMVLNYIGIDITMEEFVDKYLVSKEIIEQDGKRYGPNPATTYAGNVRDEKRGWGIFEVGIADAIKLVLKEGNQDNGTVYTSNERGLLSLNELSLLGYTPIIWTTVDYNEATDLYEWSSYDGKSTYTYPKKAHVVVLTGYDENYYYINDPLVGKDVKVSKEKLEKSFDSMGRQYVLIETTSEQR